MLGNPWGQSADKVMAIIIKSYIYMAKMKINWNKVLNTIKQVGTVLATIAGIILTAMAESKK